MSNGAPVHVQERQVFNVSPERNRQAQAQLGLPPSFVIFEASGVLNYFTGLGVVQVPCRKASSWWACRILSALDASALCALTDSTTKRDGGNSNSQIEKGAPLALSYYTLSIVIVVFDIKISRSRQLQEYET
ncbi:hypothetical protein HMJ40_18165 [Pseudomonas aeruginosa]|nr:hypothetical protein HMJ40_18165 [Pseudomonas aeruginosa]